MRTIIMGSTFYSLLGKKRNPIRPKISVVSHGTMTRNFFCSTEEVAGR